MFDWFRRMFRRNGNLSSGLEAAETETTDEVLAQPATRKNASRQSSAITSKLKKLSKEWDDIDKTLGGSGECEDPTG